MTFFPFLYTTYPLYISGDMLISTSTNLPVIFIVIRSLLFFLSFGTSACMNAFGRLVLITSRSSFALIVAVMKMPSCNSVGLDVSSLDSQSRVGFPLNTSRALIDPSLFSVRNNSARCAFFLSLGVRSPM